MLSTSQLCIFDTRIDNLSKDNVIERINYFLESDRFNQVTTINPEFLLEARKNDRFHDALTDSDLNVADGIGIKFAFWRYGRNLKFRYSGIDLMWHILEIANTKKLNIYLIANKDGLSTWQGTRDAILKVYPKLKIEGINLNIIDEGVSPINATIVFVNFGAPYQDVLINNIKNAPQSSLRLGIGVGGSFDYITRNVSRAPKFMRIMGLEWLYRLIKQPNRLSRIWKAVIIFPILILFTGKGRQKCK